MRSVLLVATIAVAALIPFPPLHAQDADVIRGRILGPDSLPVENARVTALSIITDVSRTARTDRNGRFTIVFAGGGGHYVVSVSLIGYIVRTFELKRTVGQEVLVADAVLRRPQLEPVIVTAEVRGNVPRNGSAVDISGTDIGINAGALTALQQGDLASMAASLPGVLLVPGADGAANGFSVLGLDPSDNSMTLNGMSFEGAGVPRDALMSSSLATNPYDVSRGGFSGAQLSMRTTPGSNIASRGMSLNILAPQLSWTDRASQALGGENTLLSLGGRVSGPIKDNTLFYNVSFEARRNRTPLQTLLNTNEIGLRSNGVARDSVLRLLTVLDSLDIPSATSAVGRNRDDDRASLLASFDWQVPFSSTGTSYQLTVNGSHSQAAPMSTQGSWSSLPAFLGENRSSNGSIQGRHTTYYKVVLSETSLGMNASRSESSPFTDMPAGRVRLTSIFDDGTNGVRDLAFGGNQGQRSRSNSLNVNFLNTLSWFSNDNKHRLRLGTDLSYSGTESNQASNFFGTFVFNSLADLEAGVPASYSRQLTVRNSESSRMTAAISLGDAYRHSTDLQFQFGVRVDGGKHFDAPEYNPAVESAFGVRNDHVPDRLYVSPRIGFSWTLGTAPQLAAFEGAVRGPRAVVRGGVAVQQNIPGAINQVINNTGLPNSIQSLYCVGPAAPIPDWELYLGNPDRVPDECADGSAGTVFANSTPSVTLYSRDYREPRAVRSNLSWAGAILDGQYTLTLEGTHSLNLNRGSSVDLNFDPTVRFTMDGEGGRPVFVQPTSIVEQTGAIASRDARQTQSFSRVNELRSDLRQEVVRLQLRFGPRYTAPANFRWSAGYTWQDVREQQRGFSSTVGNPLDVYWSRGSANAQHQFSYDLRYTFFRFITIGWNGSFSSGRSFTPTIGGDVNGDGSSNDRAFIFDHTNTADAQLAAGMEQLLATTSADVRECLVEQRGTLAGRNSCDGRWTLNGDLTVSVDAARLRLPARTQIDFSFANPLGGLDLLVNGSEGLKGWGQGNQLGVDPTLLYVRGFDRSTNAFRYEVNQRFGSPRQSQIRLLSPVRVTMLVRMDLGPVREAQALWRQVARGRTPVDSGTPMPTKYAASFYRSNGRISIPNPVISILRVQDSLKLNQKQADTIAVLNRRFSIQLDSIWQVAAKHLEQMPNEYDRGDAWQKYLVARHAAIDLMSVIGPAIRGVLTKAQLRKLPTNVLNTMDKRYLNAVRNGNGTYVGPPPLVANVIF